MLFRQKKALAALRRIQVFLDTHNDRLEEVNAGGARKALDEVIEKIADLGGQQDLTKFQRTSQVQAERSARHDLRETHMRPIARIAKLELRDVPEFDRLRMPHESVDTATLLMWAREMAKAAEPHRPTFLANGVGQDFTVKLLAAVDAVQKAVDARWKAHTSRVGATARIHSETRRALGILGVIDALVAPKLADDDQLARDWALTRKVARRATAEVEADTAGGTPNPPTPATPDAAKPSEAGSAGPAPEVQVATTSTPPKEAAA
jgi:hypothetical protein